MPRIKTRCTVNLFLRYCATCFAVLACSSSIANADWREDIGYNKLIALLGDSLPNGSGVPISLVEAPPVGGTAYFPDTTHSAFGDAFDPLGVAVNFIDGSGNQSNGTSTHAFDQARNFFGNTMSVAPAANEVTIYDANDYLSNVLNRVNNISEPEPQDFRVQSFSWIGTFTTSGGSESDDRKALRKFDFVIERDNITAVVGLNNGTAALPHLLSHSYNALAIGRSDGNHGVGLTRLADYGVGRSKPDLVAPRPSTSAATSSTSSVVALLHSADTVSGTDAANSETMKAILLAGASKTAVTSWSQVDSGGTWHPLDDTFGAGEVDVYASYAITASGQFTGGTTNATPVAMNGWDYQTVQPGEGNELLYDITIPVGSTAAELSIALSWNAVVSAPFNVGEPDFANLNLELVDTNGLTIDTDLSDSYVDGLSASTVDNVEHIYLTDLSPGTYTLKVSSEDTASEFGLAWRTSTLFDTFTADFDADGDIDGRDFLAWQTGFGTIVGATVADGDSDGDGDVDADDLQFLQAALETANPALAASLLAVPEPSAVLIAGSGLLVLACPWRRRQR